MAAVQAKRAAALASGVARPMAARPSRSRGKGVPAPQENARVASAAPAKALRAAKPWPRRMRWHCACRPRPVACTLHVQQVLPRRGRRHRCCGCEPRRFGRPLAWGGLSLPAFLGGLKDDKCAAGRTCLPLRPSPATESGCRAPRQAGAAKPAAADQATCLFARRLNTSKNIAPPEEGPAKTGFFACCLQRHACPLPGRHAGHAGLPLPGACPAIGCAPSASGKRPAAAPAACMPAA